LISLAPIDLGAFLCGEYLNSERFKGDLMIRKVAISLIVAVVAVHAAYQWKSVQIRGGGYVPGILFHPAETGLSTSAPILEAVIVSMPMTVPGHL
jgi:hypothetical protein